MNQTEIKYPTRLIGFNSIEEAYYVPDYPFGYGKCIKRFWIEESLKGQKKGQFRFCGQTTCRAFNWLYNDALAENENKEAIHKEYLELSKGAAWNKVKSSVYSAKIVMYLAPIPLNTKGKIGCFADSLAPYCSEEKTKAFSEKWGV